jgi:hypothetical protein
MEEGRSSVRVHSGLRYSAGDHL